MTYLLMSYKNTSTQRYPRPTPYSYHETIAGVARFVSVQTNNLCIDDILQWKLISRSQIIISHHNSINSRNSPASLYVIIYGLSYVAVSLNRCFVVSSPTNLMQWVVKKVLWNCRSIAPMKLFHTITNNPWVMLHIKTLTN